MVAEIKQYGTFQCLWFDLTGREHHHELWPDSGQCRYTIDGIEHRCAADWAHELASTQDSVLMEGAAQHV